MLSLSLSLSLSLKLNPTIDGPRPVPESLSSLYLPTHPPTVPWENGTIMSHRVFHHARNWAGYQVGMSFVVSTFWPKYPNIPFDVLLYEQQLNCILTFILLDCLLWFWFGLSIFIHFSRYVWARSECTRFYDFTGNGCVCASTNSSLRRRQSCSLRSIRHNISIQQFTRARAHKHTQSWPNPLPVSTVRQTNAENARTGGESRQFSYAFYEKEDHVK